MAQLICSSCGTKGSAKNETRGSIFIEIILWICFIIPGVIYSIWRLTTKAKVCRSCNSKELISVNSPRGKELSKEFE